MRFYVLNAIDLASHRCAIAICADNADERVASGLIALWQRLGLPVRLKLDNGGPFVGPRGLGLIARLCVHQGVIPHFIPQREPWRNGTVERFNDTFDNASSGRSASARAPSSSSARSPSRPSTTATTAIARPEGARPSRAAAAALGSPYRSRPCRSTGRRAAASSSCSSFRSDRKLRLLNRAISVPDGLVYQYLTAVLDLSIPAGEDNLRVLNAGEIVTTASIKLGGR